MARDQGLSRAVSMFCFSSMIAGTALSCATGQQNQVPTATVKDEVVTFTVPNVKPIEAGSETQKQKQIIVSVIPRAFTVSDVPKKDCVPGAEPEGFLKFVNINANGKAPKKAYIVTTQTGVDYEPKTLSFIVKFVNHSQKVMHLDELYLKVTVNNQEVEVSQLDVGKIKQAVLLKGDESQFPISVPEWRHDSGDATIDVSLQNVPIELDKVGHAAETGDFRWTFKATMETKQVQSKRTTENLMLDGAEAASLNCHPGSVAAN